GGGGRGRQQGSTSNSGRGVGGGEVGRRPRQERMGTTSGAEAITHGSDSAVDAAAVRKACEDATARAKMMAKAAIRSGEVGERKAERQARWGSAEEGVHEPKRGREEENEGVRKAARGDKWGHLNGEQEKHESKEMKWGDMGTRDRNEGDRGNGGDGRYARGDGRGWGRDSSG
ncbi:unnamed protein product, partial [Choristocarpus tenellus]